MAKKKKNSNYVTDKTIAAKEQKELEKRKKKIRKTVKTVAITILVIILIAGAVIGIGAALGMFDYTPEATAHVNITIEGYDEALHVELYGEDAPETVKNFTDLVKSGKFTSTLMHTYKNGLLYGGGKNADGGDKGIKGEFEENGFENKISLTRGVIAMARGEDNNSAYDQFFIVTEDDLDDLDGKYAAFAYISGGMDVIEDIIKNAEVDDNGVIKNPPKILSISAPHAAH